MTTKAQLKRMAQARQFGKLLAYHTQGLTEFERNGVIFVYSKSFTEIKGYEQEDLRDAARDGHLVERTRLLEAEEQRQQARKMGQP